MSRFPAELVVTLADGRVFTECYNQAEMAHFTRQRLLECLHEGKPLVLFDGERIELSAQDVASVQVVFQTPVAS